MKQKAYARAGVDIDLGNQVKSALPRMLRATHRPEVLGKVGGFGGLFALDVRKYREPVLVSSVDGVGTKLKLAFALDRHDTIGQDLVNHCVNDIAVLGAEPLFFLDYLGTGKLEPRVFKDIIKGFAKACAENHCALIGGETAQMPGFYQPGEYDVSGTIVGVVEKSRMLDGKAVRPGDAVIGLASSGLHTNGYSLARKIFFEQMGLKPQSYVPELRNTIGAGAAQGACQLRPADSEAAEEVQRRTGVPPVPKASQPSCRRGQAGRLPHYQEPSPTSPAAASWITSRACCPKPATSSSAKAPGTCCRSSSSSRPKAACRRTSCIRSSTWASAWSSSWRPTRADEVLAVHPRAKAAKAWLIGQVVKGRGAVRVV